jgi:hypothetical protein
MPEAVNLYAPPKAQVEDVVPFSDEAHAIRTEHIKTEASVRSIGSLYYLGAGLMALAALGLLASGFRPRAGSSVPFQSGFYIGMLTFGVLSFWVARGIRAFRPWARITSLILSGLSLLAGILTPPHVPVGGIVSIYILYLLLSKKGRRVFQSDYPDIIAATPDVKYKTSVVVWVFLALLVLAILVLVIAGVSARMRH